MQLSHTRLVRCASFDEPNLVSSAGLVPLVALAEQAGLRRLVEERLSVPTDKGANAGAKTVALVAGMVAGADSIEDLALLRHERDAAALRRVLRPLDSRPVPGQVCGRPLAYSSQVALVPG